MKSTARTSMLVLLLALTGCASGERFYPLAPVPVSAGTPRDAVALELERSGSALARAWEDAGRRALRAGLSIAPSFHERLRFPTQEPHAVAYRFALRRGQSLNVAIDAVDLSGPLFVDVFEVVTEDMYRHVFSPATSQRSFAFSASADAHYVLRLQPQPGSGGTHDVRVTGGRNLRFPVSGHDAAAIGSWFGDARDGGVRSHEGVDIFAPRGTPVVAAAAGRVISMQPSAAGGNVIWIEEDEGAFTYYYAHLDERLVHEGQRVNAGDTIGRVGNTGNAQSVSPHLHFSVYLPGRIAIDPAPWLTASESPIGVPADYAALGRWALISGQGVRLRGSPSLAGAVIDELRAFTRCLVLGGIGDWHRIVLHDGTSGFVAARYMDFTGTVGSR